MLTLHALRIELGKSYRQTIDLLSEMPGVLAEIGLARLPHFMVLRDWFETIPMARWRAFLRRSAEKRTGHAAIDSTGFDRDQPSRHYAQRAHYRVRTLKVTVLVDVETLYVTDVHVSTKTPSDFRIGPQVTRHWKSVCPLPKCENETRSNSAPLDNGESLHLRVKGLNSHVVISSLARGCL